MESKYSARLNVWLCLRSLWLGSTHGCGHILKQGQASHRLFRDTLSNEELHQNEYKGTFVAEQYDHHPANSTNRFLSLLQSSQKVKPTPRPPHQLIHTQTSLENPSTNQQNPIQIRMYTLAAAASALLLSSFASAAPTQAKGTVNIQVPLPIRGADSSSEPPIPIATHISGLPPASSLLVSSSSNTPIDASQIVCQAFSDKAGTQKIGGTFDETIPGVNLLKAGNGQLVQVTVFCADAAGVAAFSGNGGSGGGNQGGDETVRIQLNFSDEGAAQGEVPVNGQLTTTAGIFATNVANNGFISSGGSASTSCDVFGDAQGSKRIGTLKGDGNTVPFTNGNMDVPVGAIKCSDA